MKSPPTNKLIALCSLLILAWVFHFAYPLFYTQKVGTIKKEQKAKIADNRAHFENVGLTATFFKHHYNKNEKEIEIQGKMYEVITSEQVGDIVYCKLVKDDRETELNKQLVNNLSEKDKRNINSLLLWSPVFYTPVYTLDYFYFTQNVVINYNDKSSYTLKGHLYSIIKPPCYIPFDLAA